MAVTDTIIDILRAWYNGTSYASVTSTSLSTTTPISGGDMSLASVSATGYLGKNTEYSLHCVYTGAPVGTLNVSGSNNNVTFTELSGTNISISSSGNTLYNFTNQNYLYYKVLYTKTSGTGALTVTETIKGVL